MRWWERFLRRGLLPLDVPPRANEAPLKDEKEKEQRATGTNREANIAEKIGASASELVREFAAFRKQLQADDQAEQRERREYETGELYWTRIAAVAAILFSFLSIILSGLTLLVLDKTLGVYRGQATIMATQAALTREAIEAAQRPILMVKMTNVTLTIGTVPTAKFEVDNLGRVPALKVRLLHCADIAIIPDDKIILPDCQKLKIPIRHR